MILDNLFIGFVHFLCENAGALFTPLFRLVSMLGEKAWFFLLIAIFLCLSKKTRWIGVTIIFAIFLGFIFADVIMKPIIMRPRPYNENNLYYEYWLLAGAIEETNYSMPSGHTIGIAAFFISLYICSKKQYRKNIFVVGIISIILMILSRCYFMHHYLTDCVVGVLVAFVASFISKPISKMIKNTLIKYQNIPLLNFVLNFDLYDKILR